MKASVIIGSLFGDEGKGIFCNYLASQLLEPQVIRYNGGSQAGHTVTTDTQKHIFHHFGSGTFSNAPTILSEYFLSNPILYFKEKTELERKTHIPTLSVHMNSLLTTPYDMILNQIAEKIRGNQKHGSCGCGIFETIYRHKHFPLTVGDIYKNTFIEKVDNIRKSWVRNRLDELNIKYWDKHSDHQYIFNNDFEILKSENLFGNFIKDCLDYFDDVKVISSYDQVEKNNFIFEGAQGLLLDQNNIEYWPNLTPSNTGIDNVLKIAQNMKIDSLNIYYTTRCYITRHGQGNLPNELDFIPYNIVDETNIPNNYQGAIRYAYLDLDLLIKTINKDFEKSNIPATKNIVVSCMDQVDNYIKYYVNKNLMETSKEIFLNTLQDMGKFDSVYINTSPRSETIEKLL